MEGQYRGCKGWRNPQFGKSSAAARPVVNTSTAVHYASVTAAAEAIGMPMKHLYARLSGRNKNDTDFQFASQSALARPEAA